MKNWQWPFTWALVIELFVFVPLVSSGQSNSPYIRDAQNAIKVRRLLPSFNPDLKQKWTFTIAASAGKEGNDSVLIFTDESLLQQFADYYLNNERNNLRDTGRNNVNPNPKTDGKPVNGKPAEKGALPSVNDQVKGPYTEQIENFTVNEERFNAPADEERAELIHEIKAMLLVTDKNSKKRNYLKYFPNFPSTFPHASSIITFLQSKAGFTASVSPQSSAAGLIPGLGFNEANIIYGITDWAIKTAKRQLLEAVLEKYFKQLESDTITKTLLTSTLKTYSKFKDDNAVNLAKYGDLWKASFQEDLRNVPVHFQDETFVNLVIERITPDWTAKNEVVSLIAGSTTIVYGVSQNKHPINIIDELGTKYVTSAASIDEALPIFQRTVLLANVVARITGEMKDGVYQTLSLKDLRDLTLPEWTTFLGLTYARNKTELTLSLGKDPADILDEIKAGPTANFYNLLVNAVSGYSAMRDLLASSVLPGVETQQKKLTVEELSKVMKLAGAVVKGSLPYILKKADLRLHPEMADLIDKNWDPVCQAVTQIGEGVTTREYGAVLDGTLQLLVRGKTVFSQASIKNGWTSKLDNEVIVALTRYGSMMVNILSAKTPEAVAEALDELVPKDQYKLKNVAQWSFSLSLYPGVFGGWETIRKQDPNVATKPNPTTKSTEGNIAVYLPIGLDVSWGTGKSAWILFAQALDLGAVLNYRLTGGGSTEQSNPNISFQQLLSPGLSFMHQFRNTPLVFGTGINYTPSLRKIEETNLTYNANAFRFGFFFGVDITALHISLSKTKK